MIKNEKEVRETSRYIIATNNIKDLGVLVTKGVKDLFNKSCKSLKKNMKEIPECGNFFHVFG